MVHATCQQLNNMSEISRSLYFLGLLVDVSLPQGKYNISDGNANVAQQHSLHHASSGGKNFGFAVVGTLKREPVAPGADLMCYSGWSASNYLVRGYDDLTGNTDYTHYGTNDFMWHFWVYPSGGTTGQALIGVGDAHLNNGFKIGISQNSGGWYLQIG